MDVVRITLNVGMVDSLYDMLSSIYCEARSDALILVTDHSRAVKLDRIHEKGGDPPAQASRSRAPDTETMRLFAQTNPKTRLM